VQALNKNYSTIKVKQKKNTAWITLNRPHKLNAITQQMLKELSQAIDQIRNDKNVKSIVIKGEGKKAFSVGADLTELRDITPETAALFSVNGQQAFSKIEDCKKPVLAAINGYALGGGLELALACDFRVATKNSELGCPEVKLGFLPAWGGTQRLPVVAGVEDAKRLIMQGDSIKADEALEIGLVDRVVSAKELEPMAGAIAQRLGECPQDMVKHAKNAITSVTKTPFELGFKRETEAFVNLVSQKETKQKIADFLAQRNKK
jgi:enoyl-CoA hydratase/carnithine racemase